MERRRPTRVLVDPEYGLGEHLPGLGVSLPVWDRSETGFGTFTAEELGISEQLAERLVAWNDEWAARLPEQQRYWPEARQRRWVAAGRRLAWQLQLELPDVEVCVIGGREGDVPIREVRRERLHPVDGADEDET